MNSPILWLLVLVFGFYFIGEHGVLNWLLLYCKDQFGMDSNIGIHLLIYVLWYHDGRLSCYGSSRPGNGDLHEAFRSLVESVLFCMQLVFSAESLHLC